MLATMQFLLRGLFAVLLAANTCIAMPHNMGNSSEMDAATQSASVRTDKLILILVDGFRHDYPDRPNMTGFDSLRSAGVRARYMEPVFPSLSYPNYYSLVTGKYPENHGMVGNIMYDEQHDSTFRMLLNVTWVIESQPFWWNGSEPLWVTAGKHNKKVAMYKWPGCQVEFDGVEPPYKCIPYDSDQKIPDFRLDLASAVQDVKENGVDLAMVYVEHVDKTTHRYGPDSSQGHEAVYDIDAEIRTFVETFKQENLDDKVNVIVVSDHGMADTGAERITIVALDTLLDLDDIRYVVDSAAYCGIFPEDGKLQKIYDILKEVEGIRVYKKQDIPARLGIKNHYRTAPLVLLADKGYYITGFYETKKQVPYKKVPVNETLPRNMSGTHGYDTELDANMNGIFFGMGPAFKVSYTGEPMKMVDVYNVMTNILGISTLPNDGTWDNMKDFLLNQTRTDQTN